MTKNKDIDRFQKALSNSGTFWVQDHSCIHCVTDQGDFFEHGFQLYTLPLDMPPSAPRLILEFNFDAAGAFTCAHVLDADSAAEYAEALYSELEEGQLMLDSEANCPPGALA
jgi:hypothetical protein